jgi:hypothetical protein
MAIKRTPPNCLNPRLENMMRIKLLAISAVTYLCRSKNFGNSLFSTSLVFLSEKSSTPAEAANGLVGPELGGDFLKIISRRAVQRESFREWLYSPCHGGIIH